MSKDLVLYFSMREPGINLVEAKPDKIRYKPIL
jgi:hypothetical protein